MICMWPEVARFPSLNIPGFNISSSLEACIPSSYLIFCLQALKAKISLKLVYEIYFNKKLWFIIFCYRQLHKPERHPPGNILLKWELLIFYIIPVPLELHLKLRISFRYHRRPPLQKPLEATTITPSRNKQSCILINIELTCMHTTAKRVGWMLVITVLVW
jgi:hypothetical protein